MFSTTAFTTPFPLKTTLTDQRSLTCRPSPTQLSLSTPRSKPKSTSQTGKRVPTFRKLQTRHQSGPASFRKTQERVPTVITKDAVAVSTIAPIGLKTLEEIAQERKKARYLKRKTAVPLRDLQVGQVFNGVVNNTVRHGAYIDIGAARDGLVHLRDLSVDFVHEVEDLVRPDDKVIVWVKYIDTVENVLGLTMVRPALGFEGRTAVSDVVIGARYNAVVQRVTNFGAYIDIGSERMAFLHVSAMWGRRPRETLEFLRIGQKIWVAVEDVDEVRSHIRLIARGLGGQTLTKDNAVGTKVIMSPIDPSPSTSRAQLLESDNYVPFSHNSNNFYEEDEEVDAVDDVAETASEETLADADGDENGDEDGDDDEFDFVNEMDSHVPYQAKGSDFKDIVDDDTEYIGLDPSDIEKLKKFKLSMEETG